MTLWLAFSLMTAAAIFAVVWPLSRGARGRDVDTTEIYRDQLGEIGRDLAMHRIGEAEAHAARVEVSRRLLAAADAQQESTLQPGAALRHRRIAALAALVLLPLIAGGIYLLLGSPNMPGAPLAARLAVPPEQRSLASLVSQAEAHVERNAGDGRGWEVLAPVYLRMGRFDDAVRARKNALALNGETADRRADLGEALVAAGNGIVSVEAKAAFDGALALNPKHEKARFFIGLALQQDGRKAEAARTWQTLLDEAPPDAPWAATVRQALAELAVPAGSSSGPSAEDVAAASKLREGERNEMVRGMVARLAARMKDEPGDLDGWLRLIRAYTVLGEREQARAAAADARRALGNDRDKAQRIDDLVKALGLS
ncbi:MAG: c-type cytochrome biogenesis protein CcmI [Pseudolabrys sp.]|nr:c-type cytochrome biogenesis protein CcmI [Pseudolabrys sp.]